jgi:hypothetical protein
MLCASILAALMSAGAAQASVTISTNATKNMSCSAGVCSPTAKKAVLNVNDLTAMLAAGDVKVTTGAGAVTITIAAPFSWSSTSRLTLDAYFNVSFRATVTVAGTGAVTIVTNDGGSGGDLSFAPGAKLDLDATRGALTINGYAYRVSTALDHLATAIDRNPSGYFALGTDVDAANDGTYASSPIQSTLAGRFEGLGHTISNLSIGDRFDECVGLFKRIDEGGYAGNVVLAGVRMTSSLPHYGRLGAVAGCNKGVVANSFATGMLTGIWVGGLVGYNDGAVISSGTDAVVAGKIAGGVVGASEGTLSRCRAFGPISGFFIGKRTGFLYDLGGLAGRATEIDRSYAMGQVSLRGVRPRGDQHSGVGGLAGRVLGNITDSYATGPVQAGGVSLVGGVVGRGQRGEINHAYALGIVQGSTEGTSATGGVTGSAEANLHFSSVYWDVDTTTQAQGCGTGDCGSVSGLTDAELRFALPAGFDPKVWGQSPSINNGYPYLLANPPPQ